MFHNYLAAALRNLVRNRLYTAVTVGGLAVGLAAALLIALFVRHELGYERWIPGFENIYRVSHSLDFPGRAPFPNDIIPAKFAAWLKADFPGIQATARLARPNAVSQPGKPISLRRGVIEAMEPGFFWADPNFFELFPLPVIAGDLSQALRTPDGVVLTRSLARKYFGKDAPLGETLELDRGTLLTVTAVIEDLPSNTHLAFDVLASGLSPASKLTEYDQDPRPQFGETYTYIKVRDRNVIENIRNDFPAFIDRHSPAPPGAPAKTSDVFKGLIAPLSAIHLSPPGRQPFKARGEMTTLTGLLGVGALIVLMAAINFINLMTVSAASRVVEIGVRKVSGAERRALMIQFLGESLLYVAIAAVLAFVLANTLLPAIDGFLDRDIILSPLSDPLPTVGFAAFTVILALLGGAYPAFILSALRPVKALRKAGAALAGSSRVRSALVIVQFAVLIGLAIATATVYRQLVYLTEDRLRFETEQTLVIRTTCTETFKTEAARLAGVLNASCAGSLLAGTDRGSNIKTPDGRNLTFMFASVDDTTFEMLGIAPLAGRGLTAAEHAAGNVRSTDDMPAVINETAVALFQLGSPANAVGRALYGTSGPRVVGVVPDFSLITLQNRIEPTVYYPGSSFRPFDVLVVKLRGQEIPETLAALDRLWEQQPAITGPMDRLFLEQYIQGLYRDLNRQQHAFEALAGIAAAIAILGLFTLAAFTAEQRTKEIGIRKSMGATQGDILRLILWQFAKPVLWANLIAWPTAYFVMQRWLEGFAYHIDLAPWMFLAASALALVIAVATVIGHALLVARAQPVAALRYE